MQKELNDIKKILLDLESIDKLSEKIFTKVLKKYPKNNTGLFAKDELVKGYNILVKKGELKKDESLIAKIRMKPTRSISGVLPLTVLTRPYPCPGRCIFCPNDIRMPKSYLSDEPGAQRAEKNHFDPYLQTYNRLQAYQNTGHDLSKVELIILGGTWSYYPEKYQIWFIKRCFDALNDFGKRDGREKINTQNIFFAPNKNTREYTKSGRLKTYNEKITGKEMEYRSKHKTSLAKVNSESADWPQLIAAQKDNETSNSRCVGLVIETRPDHIDEKEVIRVRRLGSTKTQIGFQSLNDEVLELNKRGHDVDATRRAVSLVRSAGFKIHAHWMPNLYGSTPEKDKADYLKLWTEDFQPDELKIYPCSLIETAELMEYFEKGLWRPYTEEELLDVLTFCFLNTPRHVRLTRVIRDIPSTDIVTGNKKTNFREIVEREIQKQGQLIKEIRNREIRDREISLKDLSLVKTRYEAKSSSSSTQEIFLEYTTKIDDKICAFLRLSLPEFSESHFIPELSGSALIREIHVYGTVKSLGEKFKDSSQHLGLGKSLIARAKEIAKESGFKKISVISAVGTREYYRKQGFQDGELYQHANL